ncbi:MAG: GGDEF domain-containing protein [Roseburia sp.]
MVATLYAELNIFCILIVVIILRKIIMGIDMSQRQKLLIYLLISCICLFFMDLLWIFADIGVLHISIFVNYLINACYFMSTGLLGYFWFLYCEHTLGILIFQNRKLWLIELCPILLLLVLLIFSYKTGWIFYFDANGDYHRGSFYILQPLITYGYILFASIRSFTMAMKKENYIHRNEYISLISFMFFPFLCGTIQIFYQGLPLICAGITLAVLMLYLNLQEQQISLDPLTKLNNRNQLRIFLTQKLKHRDDSDKTLYLLMMDADYFKVINDKYGHIEGDAALKYIATALRKVGTHFDCFISRYGGDEFIVVYEAHSDTEVKYLIQYIHKYLGDIVKQQNLPYRLSLSIGYSKFTPETSTIQDLIHAADTELYKVKLARPT